MFDDLYHPLMLMTWALFIFAASTLAPNSHPFRENVHGPLLQVDGPLKLLVRFFGIKNVGNPCGTLFGTLIYPLVNLHNYGKSPL